MIALEVFSKRKRKINIVKGKKMKECTEGEVEKMGQKIHDKMKIINIMKNNEKEQERARKRIK